MQMFFHFGENEVILFNTWRVGDSQGIGWSALGIILLTCIYEGLRSYDDHLSVHSTHLRQSNGKKSRAGIMFSKLHFFQTLIHVIRAVIGYFLMLIFMTYNAWLCIAVAVGTALGYWLFAWNRSILDNSDCCL